MDDLTNDELREYADEGDTGTWGEVMPAMARELLRRRAAPDPFADVAAFHARFGLPIGGPDQPPRLLPHDLAKYRVKFQREELSEYVLAHEAGDLAEAADAVCDQIYVAIGTAYFMGLPLAEHWREVQRANMDKEKGPSGKPRAAAGTVDADFEIRKPPGWRPPDHGRVLREHGHDRGETRTAPVQPAFKMRLLVCTEGPLAGDLRLNIEGVKTPPGYAEVTKDMKLDDYLDLKRFVDANGVDWALVLECLPC